MFLHGTFKGNHDFWMHEVIKFSRNKFWEGLNTVTSESKTLWHSHTFKMSFVFFFSTLPLCMCIYSMCSFNKASKTQQQLIFCPSPPSFWHVPTRSTVYHGNTGWHHSFGRTGRWQWKKWGCDATLSNQDSGDIIAYQRWRSEVLKVEAIF